MDLIAGILMFVYFVGLLGFSYFNDNLDFDLHDPTFLIKLLVSLGGSGYILVYKNYDKIKEYIKNIQNKPLPLPPLPVRPETTSEEKELSDYRALVYLRKRAKELKSQEIMDLVVKINNILFSKTDIL